MEKTVVILLVLVIVAVTIAPTGALFESSADIGSGGVISGPRPAPSPPVYDTTVEFIITRAINDKYQDYKIIIRNNTDEPINGWSLSFSCDGRIYAVWSCQFDNNESSTGSTITCWPHYQNEPNYIIPANGYIELLANGELITNIWNVTVNGEEVDYTLYQDDAQYPNKDAQSSKKEPEELKPEAELGAMPEELPETEVELAPTPEAVPEELPEPEVESEPEVTPEPELDAITEAEQDLDTSSEKIPEQGLENSEAPAPEQRENLETEPEL